MNDSGLEQVRRGGRRRHSLRLQRLLFVVLGSLLLVVPTIRSSELSEIGSPNEQVENVLCTASKDTLRRTNIHGRREATLFTSSIQSRLGRRQHVELLSPNGHRLSNGLLAPMTC